MIKETGCDLNILGLRRAEGGNRSTRIKSCFDEHTNDADVFRPLFWLSNSDIDAYVEAFHIVHSKCYTEYGLKRTGCAGCPFGQNFEDELKVIEKYEPKLLKAVNHIFGESYEYTRKYRKFQKEMRDKKRNNK